MRIRGRNRSLRHPPPGGRHAVAHNAFEEEQGWAQRQVLPNIATPESAHVFNSMLIGRNRIGSGVRTRCVIRYLRSGLVQPLVPIFVQHSDLLRGERRGSHNVRRGGRSAGWGWSGVWGARQRFSGESTASARDKGPRLRRSPADVQSRETLSAFRFLQTCG